MADDLDFGATIQGMAPGQKVFGRYTLTRVLGRGGMGLVWLAHDEKLERDIALKFLPETLAHDAEALADLKRETRRTLGLTHPRIVRIFDLVDDSRTAAIAMEWVDGPTLAALKLTRPSRCFEVAEVGPWVRQLCEALTYAHEEARVVHRDLKPANLMLDVAGKLKVADFGIAATLTDTATRVSRAAGTSGTPLYMSPQQMLGKGPAVTDDIYALGATVYELLTGKPPFYRGKVELQVMEEVPPSMSERRRELEVVAGGADAGIPAAWEATIAACLAKEPGDRPQSAAEVLARLGLGGAGQDKAQKAPEVGRHAPESPLAKDGPAKVVSPKAKIPLAAAAIVIIAAGWYFGLHAPEQRRVAAEAEAHRTEVARLAADQEAERQRLAAEAARLAAARGGIIVRTTPAGAEVRVGAVALDKSPLNLKDQRLGKYPVRIRLAGFEDWDGEVEVMENEFVELNVPLVRSTGGVEITSVPAGAQVRQEGELLGVTPLRLSAVPTGPAVYELTLEEYESITITGEVKRAKTTSLAVQLDIILWFLVLDEEGRLFPLSREGKRGRSINTERWDSISVFSEGMLAVERGGKVGFIDLTGRVVVEPVWDDADGFSDGFAQVRRGERWTGKHGLIDKSGRVVIEPIWSTRVHFSEGLASVRPEEPLGWGTGPNGFIDKNWRVVIEPQWDLAKDFSEGLAAVRRGGKSGFIDKTGRVVIELQWDDAESFSEGLASVRRAGKTGYIDKTGRLVIDTRFDSGSPFSESLAHFRQGDKWGFINKSGQIVIEPNWDGAFKFREGMAVVWRADKWGFIDKTGRVVVEPQWEAAYLFSEGLASVSKGRESWGFIDKSGRVVVEPQWESVWQFKEGLAVVGRNGRYGIIDKTGKVIVQPIWKSLVPLPSTAK